MVNRITPPLPISGQNDIGGAVVRRRFTLGGKEVVNGEILTEAQVRALPKNNFRALRDNGFIQVFPKPRSANPVESRAIPKVELMPAVAAAKKRPAPTVTSIEE